MGEALRDQLRDLRRVPGLVRRSWHGFRAVDARAKASTVEVPAPVRDTEACTLNDAFTARRAWTPVALPLASIKEVKDAAGVSLNDVVLAVVASAFRGYLVARDDLPTRPLTCSVPVGLDPPGAPPRQTTNWFGSLTTSLRTDVEDPWARMLAISEVTQEAKARNELLGEALLPEWLDVIPPFITERGVLGHNRGRQRNRDQADVNVLVSNLRGPSERWHLGPALVEDLYLADRRATAWGPTSWCGATATACSSASAPSPTPSTRRPSSAPGWRTPSPSPRRRPIAHPSGELGGEDARIGRLPHRVRVGKEGLDEGGGLGRAAGLTEALLDAGGAGGQVRIGQRPLDAARSGSARIRPKVSRTPAPAATTWAATMGWSSRIGARTMGRPVGQRLAHRVVTPVRHDGGDALQQRQLGHPRPDEDVGGRVGDHLGRGHEHAPGRRARRTPRRPPPRSGRRPRR